MPPHVIWRCFQLRRVLPVPLRFLVCPSGISARRSPAADVAGPSKTQGHGSPRSQAFDLIDGHWRVHNRKLRHATDPTWPAHSRNVTDRGVTVALDPPFGAHAG